MMKGVVNDGDRCESKNVNFRDDLNASRVRARIFKFLFPNAHVAARIADATL